MTQAKEQASIADVEEIEWIEENVESLPFEDEIFVVLSSFGHMFAPSPKVAIKEMIRVTKPGGRIAFSTWPFELVNGKLFDVMAKYITASLIFSKSGGNSTSYRKRLLESNYNVDYIHFERGFINKPVLSPNHSWITSITKGGL